MNEDNETTTMESPGLGGLTIGEMAVIENLNAAWQAYLQLPDCGRDMSDVVNAVHTIQRIMAYRVAKRVDPDYWR